MSETPSRADEIYASIKNGWERPHDYDMVFSTEILRDYAKSLERDLASANEARGRVEVIIGLVEKTVASLQSQLAAAEERAKVMENALRGIIEIGKRDLSNSKYDIYFVTAKEILATRPAPSEPTAQP